MRKKLKSLGKRHDSFSSLINASRPGELLKPSAAQILQTLNARDLSALNIVNKSKMRRRLSERKLISNTTYRILSGTKREAGFKCIGCFNENFKKLKEKASSRKKSRRSS